MSLYMSLHVNINKYLRVYTQKYIHMCEYYVVHKNILRL
jgi:hypothetical protein